MDGILDAVFDKLYSENYKNLFRYAYRLTYEKNLAEEIVQDAYIEAFKKIELLNKHENPIGWLYVTVKNITKAYIREYTNIKKLLPLKDNKIATTDEANKEMFLLDYLTQEETKIMLKYYNEKRSLAQISEEYGISLSACKMRLKRARDKFIDTYEK